MKSRLRASPRRAIPSPASVWLLATGLMLYGATPVHAQSDMLGRLFYTPEQRAQLESARIRNVTRPGEPVRAPVAAGTAEAPPPPPPQRYDGVVIRSDGQATRWVNGQPEVGPSSVEGLKPGQTRARGKVYEPYQIVRPRPATNPDGASR